MKNFYVFSKITPPYSACHFVMAVAKIYQGGVVMKHSDFPVRPGFDGCRSHPVHRLPYRYLIGRFSIPPLDISPSYYIIGIDRITNKSSGCRTDPAEIGLSSALTREPDTANTVGGKDAQMGYARGIALHLDGFAMRYFLFWRTIAKRRNYVNQIPSPDPRPL